MPTSRRELLASTAAGLFASMTGASAKTYGGGPGMPWRPFAADPPQEMTNGPWKFFTGEEGATVEALVDRLIPPDPETPGGKDCGCAVFIDRQLAGPFGSAQGLYMRPPFHNGTPQQGLQAPSTPAQVYRKVLPALNEHCRTVSGGKSFTQLSADQQDKLITAMEKGNLRLLGASTAPFFDLLLQNTKEGFFADPIYGGNRDMAAWRMIGFPGARYDYRDWVERHNERYPLPPVGIGGRKEWTAQHS
ncbi:MAG TPA: gluconate 2-dehydrogenase subunit 3 family protein [Rhodopila sp.]|nr:gluconate 2-dehydrogenase subunit 3 family protein [Rhodopila sp.]